VTVETLTSAYLDPAKTSSTDIRKSGKQGREAVEVPLPVSMHTGQIIMLTKMMTSADLRFYEFDAGVPVVRWRSGPSA